MLAYTDTGPHWHVGAVLLTQAMFWQTTFSGCGSHLATLLRVVRLMSGRSAEWHLGHRGRACRRTEYDRRPRSRSSAEETVAP
eukprot:15432767-Alexandrium_andersonii.AAC.1